MTDHQTNIAIVGVGKIARDQHLPSIARSPNFHLAAAVSRNAEVEGVENFRTIEELIAARPDIPVVSLAMPPQARFAYAWATLDAGRHVMLEKPPGASLAEVRTLEAAARQRKLTLFATWHSRFAPAVAEAKIWLADRTIRRVDIVWKEDVRRWHPGQDWIWEPGGLGVFDPGINALSVLTEIMPHPVHLTGSTLEVPENRQTPIAAKLQFTDHAGTAITADFDWRQTGPQTWDITVEAADSTLVLSGGGAVLAIDGKTVSAEPEAEYDGLYARMAALLAAGKSEVDLAPMIHVADAFMLGRRVVMEPFDD